VIKTVVTNVKIVVEVNSVIYSRNKEL